MDYWAGGGRVCWSPSQIIGGGGGYVGPPLKLLGGMPPGPPLPTPMLLLAYLEDEVIPKWGLLVRKQTLSLRVKMGSKMKIHVKELHLLKVYLFILKAVF